MEKLKINLEENVTVLEIEENDNFDYNVLTDDEKKELDEVNEKKLQEALDDLMKNFTVCHCMRDEIIQRELRNTNSRLIVGGKPQATITLRQEDVDQTKYVILITTTDGKYNTIDAIISECKKCHHIEYKGSSDIFSKIIAEATMNRMNNRKLYEAEKKAHEESMKVNTTETPTVKYETVE